MNRYKAGKIRVKRGLRKQKKGKMIAICISACLGIVALIYAALLIFDPAIFSSEAAVVAAAKKLSAADTPKIYTNYSIDGTAATYHAIGELKKYEQDGKHQYTIYFPSLANKKINEAVSQDSDLVLDNYRDYYKGNDNSSTAMGCDYDIYSPGDYMGIMYMSNMFYADSAIVNTKVVCSNFNADTGERLKTDDFLSKGGIDKIATLTIAAFNKDLPGVQVNYSALAPIEKNYKNLLLTDRGLFVFINEGSALSETYGTVCVVIPYSYLGDDLLIKVPETVVPEAAPSPTATGGQAEKPVVPSWIDPSKPMVCLTFDDGPTRGVTDKILDVLQKYKAHATFFEVGSRIKGNESIVKRADALGCEIGSHTWSHKDLRLVSNAVAESEISKADDAISAVIGHAPYVLRPPYGDIRGPVRNRVDRPMILWTVDTEDWSTRNADKTFAAATAIKKSGNVVLMHDVHKDTADAVAKIIPELKKRGLQFVTISEFYAAKGIALEGHTVYRG